MKPPISLSLSATLFLLLTLYPAKSTAWLPWSNKNITSTNGTNLFEQTNGKIRGVNLASLFVLEPWMAPSEWSSMGCADTKSEFDCVLHLGQDKADASFRQHWDTWITRDDFRNITALGLNTVRVPVGYWLYEELVDRESEYFPRGGWEFFERVCRWAAEEGVYVIVDLHGAPGAQVAMNPDTGQYAPSPGFYNAYQYDRAETFLAWLTAQIHSNSNFSTVGMIELVNEPFQNTDQVASMRTDFYPNAIAKIRSKENAAVPKASYLHIQMMSKSWGSGDPNQALTNNDTSYLAYDDHRYLKYNTSIPMTKDSYLSASCGENASSDAQDTPVIVSEWSLSPAQAVEGSKAWAPESKSNKKFYKKWFAAQVHAFEKGALGWVFWGWKQELGDYRWGYQDAVNAGVIPKDLASVLDMKVCSGQIKKQITPSVRNVLVICLVIAISFPLMK